MAYQQFSFIISQMHTVALTIAEVFAPGTFVLFHPRTVTVRLESRLPYFPEVVLIDVALVIVGADTATSTDGTVNQDGTY